MKKNLIILLAAAIVLVLGFAFYSAPSQQGPKQELEKVSVQMQWFLNSNFAGYYVAKEGGFYEDEGLDVSFVEGGPTATIIENVVTGKTNFGTIAMHRIIQAREDGLDVKAVAASFQKDPSSVSALKSSGIKEPKDLIGKTVIMSPNVIIPVQAMFSELGLDVDKVKFVPFKSKGLQELEGGEVDAMATFIINEPPLFEAEGFPVNIIRPLDYGFESYQFTLFTTDRLIKENPDLVTRFVRATARGFEYLVSHQEEAVEFTRRYNQETTKEVDEVRLKIHKEIVLTPDGRFGFIDPQKVDLLQRVLVSQGLLDKTLSLEDIFTSAFLEEIYGQ